MMIWYFHDQYVFAGYKKAFDWNTYLEEEDALPVPYSFFNDVSFP